MKAKSILGEKHRDGGSGNGDRRNDQDSTTIAIEQQRDPGSSKRNQPPEWGGQGPQHRRKQPILH